MYKEVDLSSWKRYETYKHYDVCTNPFVIVNNKIDITNLYNYAKEHHLSMYAAIGYMITKTANEFEEFKYRRVDDKLVIYDELVPNFTENVHGEDIYYFDVPFNEDISKFNMDFINTRDKYKDTGKSIESIPNELWMSCAPWFTSNMIVPPFDHKYTIPILIWDKFVFSGDKVTTNLILIIHHGFIDGYQIGQFYQKLEENINKVKDDN